MNVFFLILGVSPFNGLIFLFWPLCFDASELCIDFTGTLASGSTMLLSLESFFRIVVTEPLIPRSVELATIDPQIGVRTGIGAQFTQFAGSFAAAARRTLFVRTA